MPDTPARPVPLLKPLDAIILQRIARGQTNAQIGRRVNLSPQGVDYHVSQLLRRFDAVNRAELVALAYQLGVMLPEDQPARVRSGAIDDGTRPVPGRRGPGRAVTDLRLPRGGAA